MPAGALMPAPKEPWRLRGWLVCDRACIGATEGCIGVGSGWPGRIEKIIKGACKTIARSLRSAIVC